MPLLKINYSLPFLSLTFVGYDTYRLWEVLASGGVAVVESSPGLNKIYSMLPVLVVHDLLKLSPAFLERVHDCFERHAGQWRYDFLTQRYRSSHSY